MTGLVTFQLIVTMILFVLEMRRGIGGQIPYISIGLTLLLWGVTLYLLWRFPPDEATDRPNSGP